MTSIHCPLSVVLLLYATHTHTHTHTHTLLPHTLLPQQLTQSWMLLPPAFRCHLTWIEPSISSAVVPPPMGTTVRQLDGFPTRVINWCQMRIFLCQILLLVGQACSIWPLVGRATYRVWEKHVSTHAMPRTLWAMLQPPLKLEALVSNIPFFCIKVLQLFSTPNF